MGKALGSALGIWCKSDLDPTLKELTAKCGDPEKGTDSTKIVLAHARCSGCTEEDKKDVEARLRHAATAGGLRG